MRELQNSQHVSNSMIFLLVRFLAKRHILLAIGALREIRIQRKKRGFGFEWSFAISSLGKNIDQIELIANCSIESIIYLLQLKMQKFKIFLKKVSSQCLNTICASSAIFPSSHI